MTTITRDIRGILSIDGTPTVLRGGGYDLFFNPGASIKALAAKNTEDPIHVEYALGKNPCQTNFNIAVEYAPWHEGTNSFVEFFSAMQAQHCNLVRVFLSGGAIKHGNTMVSMSPFKSQLVGNKIMFDVRGAALSGNWNTAYFDRLTAFVAAADTAGVVVQLSLFNYFDLGDDNPNDPNATLQQWSISPWNSGNCLNGGAWAEQHLVPVSLTSPQPIDPRTTKEPDRQRYFTNPENELRAVQQEFIGRVMRAISGHQNVVLELMNEPHGANTLDRLANVAEFDAAMTKLIILFRRNLNVQALISVNATPLFDPTGVKLDMEIWHDRNDLPNFLEVDIVSYHGLTAMPNNNAFKACGSINNVSVERVDGGAINDRATQHAKFLHEKALLYSTDAVKSLPFIHFYGTAPKFEMRLRDGQIICAPESGSLEVQLLRTYVYHWAMKCFAGDVGTAKGRFHFHNQSSFKAGLGKLLLAARDSGVL